MIHLLESIIDKEPPQQKRIELLGNKLKIFETLTWQAFERSFAKEVQT